MHGFATDGDRAAFGATSFIEGLPGGDETALGDPAALVQIHCKFSVGDTPPGRRLQEGRLNLCGGVFRPTLAQFEAS